MKLQVANPVVPSIRCNRHTATGRIQEQAGDHQLELLRNFEGFQTAQGINHFPEHL